VPYWTAFRIIVVSCGLAIIAVTIIGNVSSRRAEIESRKGYFVCKTLLSGLTELAKIMGIKGELPKEKVLLNCPSLSKKTCLT